MKRIKKSLGILQTHLETNLDIMEFSLSERSEKWQDSEKGNAFILKIDELEEVIDNMKMTIDSIDVFMSED